MKIDELEQRKAKGPRFLYLTDVHARNRAPKMRRDNYRQAVLDKLTFVCEAVDRLGAERTLIGGGDVFDRPNVNLDVADDLVDVFATHNCRLATVFGNHDLEASLSTAPVTVLGHLMRRSPGILTPLPLLHQKPLNVGGMHIWGHHYRYQNHGDRLETEIVDPAAPRIIVSHSMILAEAPNWEEELFVTYDQLTTNAHAVLLGHYHPQQRMQRLDNDAMTWIGGPGALMRGSLSRDDLSRIPAFAVIEHDLETEDLVVDFVDIDVAQPAEAVFKLEEAKAENLKAAKLDEFRAGLSNLKVAGSSVTAIIEQISEAEGIPEDVKEESLRRIGAL